MILERFKPSKVILASVFLTLLLVSDFAVSNLRSDVRKAFQDMTSMRNSTRAGAYKGQTAMHYTGGSYMERYPIRNYQIYSFQGPTVSAGCGGIDLFGGGFSHINSDQIKQAMANIAANAKGLVYKLGIDIVSAQLGSVLTEMQKAADDFKSLSINSCEAATAIVGGAHNIVTGAEMGCTSEMVKSGRASSYPEAVKLCRSGSEPMKPDEMDKGELDQMPLLGNLVWRSMTRTDLFNANGKANSEQALRYVLMSMIGTIIKITDSLEWLNWTLNDASYQGGAAVIYKGGMDASKLGEALNSLMYGGKVETLECTKLPPPSEFASHIYACAGMKKGETTISADDAFYNQVDSSIKALIDGLANDDQLTLDQEALLNSTSLPVWTLLASAYAAGGSNLANQHRSYLAEIIAREYMHSYLDALLSEVKKVVTEAGQQEDSAKSIVLENIDTVKNNLLQLKEQHEKSQNHVYTMLAQYESYRKVLISRVPSVSFEPKKHLGSGF